MKKLLSVWVVDRGAEKTRKLVGLGQGQLAPHINYCNIIKESQQKLLTKKGNLDVRGGTKLLELTGGDCHW